LAINVSLDSVVVNPQQIKDPENTAAALAEVLGLSADKVLEKIQRETSFEYVARKIEPEQSKAVRH